MKLKLLIAAGLMALSPLFCFAQGNSNGKGNKGKGNNSSKELKVKTNPQKHQVRKSGTVRVRQTGNNTTVRRQGPPSWAPAHGYRRNKHVYFQDYYTYYDPNRGYIYWNGSRWVSSSNVPGFLSKVDLSKSRVQILNDLDLARHPEDNYARYMRIYPAQRVSVVVPVPALR
ncbi:MAG: hypothetical protein EOP49_01785 [Sphingobacteriales bacterium]|nr:MAG: hypothetical protein EOP49_01785 [Sphingobacteriales bacterium]